MSDGDTSASGGGAGGTEHFLCGWGHISHAEKTLL